MNWTSWWRKWWQKKEMSRKRLLGGWVNECRFEAQHTPTVKVLHVLMQPKLVIVFQSMCSDASAKTSSLLLFLLVAKIVLGFLTKHLNLKLINALLSFLQFPFNFLFFFCQSPKWIIVLSWTILSTLLCSFNVLFSCLICRFRTSSSNTSCFKDWTYSLRGNIVLGSATDCSKASK